jgi:hypothetical protein
MPVGNRPPVPLLLVALFVQCCFCFNSPVRHSQGDFVDTLISVDSNGVLIARQTIGEFFMYLTYESYQTIVE